MVVIAAEQRASFPAAAITRAVLFLSICFDERGRFGTLFCDRSLNLFSHSLGEFRLGFLQGGLLLHLGQTYSSHERSRQHRNTPETPMATSSIQWSFT